MRIPIVVCVLACAALAFGNDLVAPNTYATQGGTSGLNTLLRDAPNARTYQFAIDPSQLTMVPDGGLIQGVTWRIRAVATYTTWPATDAHWANYDIQVSKSNFPVGALSTTFADNIGPDVVIARAGALTVPANSFPGGAVWPPNLNDFGYNLMFAAPYTYHTGDTLLFTVRHDGNDTGTNRFLDSISSTAGAGMMQALSATSYTATTGSSASISIAKIIYVPEPASVLLAALGLLLRRR
ncbi:MAG: hypothetical protein AB1716_06715 [Planctomycetota bacterium]